MSDEKHFQTSIPPGLEVDKPAPGVRRFVDPRPHPRNPQITYRAVVEPEKWIVRHHGANIPVHPRGEWMPKAVPMTARVVPNEAPDGVDCRTHIERINQGDNPSDGSGTGVPHKG